MGVGHYQKIRELEQRIRASKPYHDWVRRNKAPVCLRCDATENLECHHMVELYHILLGLWKVYEDADETVNHAISMHIADRCEPVTLCHKCHGSAHPKRLSRRKKEVQVETWTVLPRNLELRLNHSTKQQQPGTLGLVAFQTLLGIGWHIMNGHVDSRVLTFNRPSMGHLLEKKRPGSSFNRSLMSAMNDLQEYGILRAWYAFDDEMEIHITSSYLHIMQKNPWFLPLRDVPASRMCVVALRCFLRTVGRKNYRIGLEKLKKHLGITEKSHSRAAKSIMSACEQVWWANLEMEGTMCRFTLNRSKAVPIHSLRTALDDAMVWAL